MQSCLPRYQPHCHPPGFGALFGMGLTQVEEHSSWQFLGRLGTWFHTTIPILHGRRIRWLVVSGSLLAGSTVRAQHWVCIISQHRKSLRDRSTVWGTSLNPKTSFSHLFPGAVTVPAVSVPSGPSRVPVASPFLLVMLKRLPVKPTAPYFQVQKCACPLAIR